MKFRHGVMVIKTIVCYFLVNLLIIKNNATYAQLITTVVGGITGHGSYWGDGGLATDAAIGYFQSVAVDAIGNIYIGDANNQRVRKVDISTGIIHTIAGTGVAGYNGDNIAATSAQLNYPGPITFDSVGNIFIIDGGNYRIRKIDILSGQITTFAGNGILGSTGDGGPATAAEIEAGYMAWDNIGNLYITCSRKIRKIASGTISTVAGTGLPGITGDGVPATATNLGGPTGLATDVHGNVYFGDSTSSVRKITISSGLINRVAGTGNNIGIPYSGDGIDATSCHVNPFDISVDDTGNLYISDYGNSRIEKVDTFGIIHTIAGTGVSGFSGDGGLAIDGQISLPENVVLDNCNNAYIADFNNRRVRKVTFHPSCTLPVIDSVSLDANKLNNSTLSLMFPNPAHNMLNMPIPCQCVVAINNMLGQVMMCKQMIESMTQIDIASLPAGMYMLVITSKEGERTIAKFVKE